MAFIPLPDGAQLVLVYGFGDIEYTNTLHVTKTGWTEGDAAALMEAVRSAWNGLTTRPFPQGHTLKQQTLYDHRSEFAPIYYDTTTALFGSYTGEIADRQTAMVITFRTARRGRSGRGRWYIGGATEGQMVGGQFGGPYVTAVLVWVNAVLATCTAQGWTPVIKSTQQDGAVVSPADAFPITLVNMRSYIPGSQDRRNRRP